MSQETTRLIRGYVDRLKEAGVLQSKPVEHAFRRIERHRLLEWIYLPGEECGLEYAGMKFTKRDFDPQDPDPELLKIIYSDQPLLTRLDPPSSTSQPTLVANMLELLELEQGMNVLEIGAGTGYNAALMQEIVGATGCVTTIDIQEEVVEQTARLLKAAGYDRIEVIAKDGARGHPGNAPYDRIVATVGCHDISFCWAEQLTSDGFMLIPLQHGGEGMDPLTEIRRGDDKLSGRFVGFSGFMSIRGELEIEQKTDYTRQKQITSGAPSAEYPLFSVLAEIRELREKRLWDKALSFPLFMAIVDARACQHGLYEDDRAVVINFKDNKIDLYGDEFLYHDLKFLCERWEYLGRPGYSAWQLEFFPDEHSAELHHHGESWMTVRKFSTEITSLNKNDSFTGENPA